MSEPVAKQRPTANLDSLERRLRQSTHPHAHEEDPLAELARLVGEQHDPYGDVFAQDPRTRQPPHEQARVGREPAREPVVPLGQGRLEPAFDVREAARSGQPVPSLSPRLFGDFAAIEAGLRGAAPGSDQPFAEGAGFGQSTEALLRRTEAAHAAPREYDPARQEPGHGDQAHREQAYQDQAYQDQAYQDPAYQDPAYGEQGYPAQPEQGWAPPAGAARSSRRPVAVMAATIAVAVIGISGAFALKGATSGPAQIKTILAAAGPIKVQQPAETNDNGPAAGPSSQVPTKLVNREEEPVDLTQAVQDNAARGRGASTGDASSVPVPLSPGQAQNAEGAPGDGPEGQLGGFGSDLPAPKKVKVVSVTPEGVILPNDRPPVAAMPATRPVSAKTGDHAGPVAKASTPRTATPKTTSRVAPATIEAAAGDDAADGAAPKGSASKGSAPKDLMPKDLIPKTVKKAKPQRVASTDPGASEATEAAEPKVSGDGGFAVQLAAPGSEAEAKAVSARLGKRFADALSGHQLAFHKADSNGKSVYRVRVSSLSKEDAVSLCEKLKADHGSCFVAKN